MKVIGFYLRNYRNIVLFKMFNLEGVKGFIRSN